MFLKAIRLRMFQSHKETDLDLHPGMNALVGRTGQGKTAVLRGLDLVVNNDPNDPSVFTSWASKDGKVSVTVETSDGHIVERERSLTKSTNTYKLDDNLLYKAFGVGVPEDISNVLKLTKLNKQSQFDGPYMFLLKDGDVAREFNTIAHLDCIDHAYTFLESKRRKTRTDLSSRKATLENELGKLKKYTGLADVEAEALRLEEKQHAIDALERDLGKAENNLRLLKNAIDRLSRYAGIQESLKEIQGMSDDMAAISDDEQKADQMSILIRKLMGTKEKLSGYAEIGQAIKEIESMRDKADVNALSESTIEKASSALRNFKLISKRLSELSGIGGASTEIDRLLSEAHGIECEEICLQDAERALGRFNKTVRESTEAKDRYKKLHSEFDSKFPDFCPLCGK